MVGAPFQSGIAKGCPIAFEGGVLHGTGFSGFEKYKAQGGIAGNTLPIDIFLVM